MLYRFRPRDWNRLSTGASRLSRVEVIWLARDWISDRSELPVAPLAALIAKLTTGWTAGVTELRTLETSLVTSFWASGES
jgi:pheromone shutdown protein TraB